MIKLIILAVLVAGNYGAHIRIVNGTDAGEGEFPFSADLLRNGTFVCGSTILNERFVLTSNICACPNKFPSNYVFSIQYGLTTRVDDVTNVIKVKEITCNENYDDVTFEYDVAVLELESPIPEDGSWEPVKLTKTFESVVEQKGVIIGWGQLGEEADVSKTLQKIDVIIFTDQICGKNYSPLHHVCIGTEIYGGACFGDAGSALLFNGAQIGIGSFILGTCGIATQFHPNYYSRVPTYIDWIESIAGNVTYV